MKRKKLIPALFAFVVLGLLISSFVAKESRIEQHNFPFHRTYSLRGQSQDKTMGRVKEWMRNNYGEGNMIIGDRQLIAYGSFYIISRNFLGKTTKTCHYTFSVQSNGDSLAASVEEVYFTWYQAPQHKGSRGGMQFKTLSDILPLEKKVPFEKASYRQYLEQMEEHFEKVFQHTQSLIGNTTTQEEESHRLLLF